MVHNIVGPPARGDDFFNREELVALLWNRLEAGNVLLAGPRRFGKTSLMYRLIDQPNPVWKPIHVDAESIREPVNFVIALLDALMADHQIRKTLISAWKGSCQWLRGLLQDIEVTGPWDVGVKIRLKESMRPQWQERGEALLRAVRAAAQKLLIIVDELPVMLYLFADNGVSDADTRAFLYWFRKLRTDPEVGLTNCRFLVGGSIGIEHRLSQLGAAASFNDFERVTLNELKAKRAAEFLRQLLKSRGVSISPPAQRTVLDLVGAPIPYFLQVFVSEIAAETANGAVRLGPQRLEEIYRDRVLGASCKGYFQHYYDRLRHYDKRQEQAAKAMLKALALAHPQTVPRDQLRVLAQPAGLTEDEVGQLVVDLENDFYIRYQTEANGYLFASKILCDWWRRYYAF